MSAPLRFLGLAIITYVGLRTAGSALALQPLVATPPALPATGPPLPPPGYAADMGPLPPGAYPVGAYAPGAYPPGAYPPGAYPPGAYPYAYAQPAPPAGYGMIPYQAIAALLGQSRQGGIQYVPMPYAMPAAGPAAVAPAAAAAAMTAYEGAGYDQPSPALDQWPTIGTAGPFSMGGMQTTPRWGKGDGDDSPLEAARPRRWSVDAWALLRPPREGVYAVDDPGIGINPGLASGGALGGSQAGMRITWRPLDSVGIHARASTALLPNGRSGQTMAGGEGALGVSWQPLRGLPVRLLAERRQRLGPELGGGRNAFALMAEGGLYDRPIAFGIRLDGYAQAGVVGSRRRDLFADGALTVTYPLLSRLSIGGGLWGGIQPGLHRFDAGPRLSYQLRPGLRAHVDYRFRVSGNAEPLSGPALTLAAGF